MVKIIETTKLSGGLTSFRTELEEVDTNASLETRYERYKELLGEQPASESADSSSVAGE